MISSRVSFFFAVLSGAAIGSCIAFAEGSAPPQTGQVRCVDSLGRILEYSVQASSDANDFLDDEITSQIRVTYRHKLVLQFDGAQAYKVSGGFHLDLLNLKLIAPSEHFPGHYDILVLSAAYSSTVDASESPTHRKEYMFKGSYNSQVPRSGGWFIKQDEPITCLLSLN